MKKSKSKKILTYGVIGLVAMIAALNYQLFVFPNRFAPAGLNGICTMIQYLSGISVGYLSLIINIPLAIFVYLKVSRSLAKRSMFYVAVFSIKLVQETMLAFVIKCQRGEPIESPKGFLSAVLQNKYNSYLRKRYKSATLTYLDTSVAERENEWNEMERRRLLYPSSPT